MDNKETQTIPLQEGYSTPKGNPSKGDKKNK